MQKRDFLIGLSLGFAIPFLSKFIQSIYDSKSNKQELNGKIFVGIQLGGTNYNVAIGESITNNKGQIVNFRILKKKNGITYDDPEQSIQGIISFIRESAAKSQINKEIQLQFIGIASFGPLCLDRSSPLYGSITSTPKVLWRGQKVLEKIKEAFKKTKVEIDTDVNAAAYAEYTLGNHNVRESLVYVTVGTGVGVGVISHGKTVHGLTHPEGGHIIVERSVQEYEHFKGVCPFHSEQTCLQSMVSNLSIAKRLDIDFTKLADIGDDEKVWRLIGFYLAQLCLNVTLLLSPEVIIIGGGIMNRKLLFPLIHKQFMRMLSKYVDHPLLGKENIEDYIKSPALGENVGVIGAMMLSTLAE